MDSNSFDLIILPLIRGYGLSVMGMGTLWIVASGCVGTAHRLLLGHVEHGVGGLPVTHEEVSRS